MYNCIYAKEVFYASGNLCTTAHILQDAFLHDNKFYISLVYSFLHTIYCSSLFYQLLNRFPKEVVMASSLLESKEHLDDAFSPMV